MTNFYKAQKEAKSKIIYLIFLFCLAVGFIIVAVDFCIAGIISYKVSDITFWEFLEKDEFIYLNCTILFIMFIGVLFQYLKLSKGGKAVAQDLGAREISSQTTNLKEKVFLNVVEEISIASNTPIPTAYILKDDSINAFVSGYGQDDTIICITKGALEKLNREELQGVVAHEFSHIFHGDMKLNMRISSFIFGLFSLAIVGRFIIENMSHRRSSSNKNSGMIYIIALVFFIFGYLGEILGSIINAAISRQKEYLADASAVKYTRNPTGISNALKKIYKHSSLIKSSPNAQVYGHFYFAEGFSQFFSSMLATHPPLKKRILAVEPSWDGRFKIKIDKKKREKEEDKKQEQFTKIITTAIILDGLKNIHVNDANIQKAKKELELIPIKLKNMSQEPFSSQAVILAVLASDHNEVSNEQLKKLSDKNPRLYKEVIIAYKQIFEINEKNFNSLILLCLSSLKQMSKNQYIEFKSILNEWIYENKKVVFLEWLIQRIILNTLDMYFGLKIPLREKYDDFNSLKEQLEFYISFLCFEELKEKESAKELFDKITKNYHFENYTFNENAKEDFERLSVVLDKLLLLNNDLRNRLLQISLHVLNEDKILSTSNKQILYAVSLSLKTPLPYM